MGESLGNFLADDLIVKFPMKRSATWPIVPVLSVCLIRRMQSDDPIGTDEEWSHPQKKKPPVGERLKQLQEKTGDLCETLDRIEKSLLEAAAPSRAIEPSSDRAS